MEQLVKKRAVIKSQVTRFGSFVDEVQLGNKNIAELKTRLKRLEKLWDEFDNIQTEIEENEKVTNQCCQPGWQRCDEQSQSTERETFENKYFEVISHAEEITELNKSVNKTTIVDTYSQFWANLPSLNLPQFKGSYEEWLRFFELYKSLVHDNARLNKIQKFYYLQSCLKDDALRIINSLEISEANYDVAIELLRERYANKKVLIRNHVKNIFELQPLTRESHVNLRKLIDNFLKDFRSLQTLGEPVQHWDTLLIHIVSIKLDKQTQREWETHSKNITTPKLDKFVKVLKEKCQLLESLDGKLANKFNERTNEKVSMHITSNNEKNSLFVLHFLQKQ
ncbi:uncharacterized protein [Onthophagus taurus]|uniref:uncharacterized protein n=1 Tax=Onthophagus taurus TaxID=166361 RepID=UPI0039BE27FF